jgi:exosome complex exonuclease RRP6
MDSAQGDSQGAKQTFLPEYPELDPFAGLIFEKLIESTKLANELPSSDDFAYYNTFKPFKGPVQVIGKKILNLANKFLRHRKPKGEVLETLDDVTESYDSVIDLMDEIVEDVDSFIDESTGVKEKSKVVVASPKVTNLAMKGKPDAYIFHGSNILRPQENWKDEIDNSYAPFVPKLPEKPNALVPMDDIFIRQAVMSPPKSKIGGEKQNMSKEMEMHLSSLGITSTTQNQAYGAYPHPYEYELNHLEFREDDLKQVQPQMYKTLEETPFTWVDDADKLQVLSSKLEKAKEIAIDLEHHAFRTYQGFTCLMQISTREEDFIVDTLVLKKQLWILNRAFTNPNIVKVLHGSDSDLMWLQRDFGLFIVNLFDTGQAARVLEFPSFGLAFIMKHYCNINADKKYQLADWRIRPLPAEMIKYAREDTHYLLYMYDRIRNDALNKGNQNKNLLMAILNRSKELCYKKYEKEMFQDDSYRKLYNKHNVVFSPAQLRVFAGLFNWRDKVARIEDESTRYVLPNHMMFRIAELMPLTMENLLACCNPVPPLVRVHIQDIVQVIKTEKDRTDYIPDTYHDIDLPKASGGAKTGYFVDETSPAQTALTSNTNSRKTNLVSELLLDASDPNFKTRLMDAAGWNEDRHSVQKALLAAANKDLKVRSRNGALFSDSDSEEENEAQRTAAAIRQSFGNDFLNPVKFDEQNFEAEDPALMYNRTADHIIKPTHQQQDVDMAQVPETPTKFPLASSGASVPPLFPVISDVPVVTSAPVQQKTTTVKTTDGLELEGIPMSMAEIYKLSNQSRKRKKKKQKKGKEETGQSDNAPNSPFMMQDGDQEIDIRATKRQKISNDTSDDNVHFMKEIGWIDASNNMSIDNSINNSNVASSDFKSPMTSPTKKKSKPNLNQNFVPFDYSKADFDAPQQAQQPQQHFSPYKEFKEPGRQGGNRGHKANKQRSGARSSSSATYAKKGSGGGSGGNRNWK